MKMTRKSARLSGSFIVAAIIVISSIASFTPFEAMGQVSASPNGTLRLTLVGEPVSLNQLTAPRDCESCWQVISLEYAFGMPQLQNGSYNLPAALFDRITVNPNATIWNLNIRPGARWSDGVPISSSDVNFTFGLGSNYTMYSGSPTDLLHLYNLIRSVNIVNSSETQFILKSPDSTFGYVLSSQYYYVIVPEHIWASRNFNTDNNFAQDVTSGPFYHLTYNGGQVLVLKANPYYWNSQGLSEIEIFFVSSSSQAASLLQSNQTDLARVDPSLLSSFLDNPQYGVNVEPDRGMTYMEYNVSEYPFSDLSFRQALALAINTSSISQNVYDGYATPGFEARGMIPPSAPAWHNSSTVQYDYNPAQANQTLSAAGYTWKGGQLYYPAPNDSAVSLKIFTDSNNTADNSTSQMVADYLRALKIQVSISVFTINELDAAYTIGVAGVRSGLVIESTETPIFGIGYLDVQPAFDLYYPWSVTQPYWVYPPQVNAEYSSLLSVVNTSTSYTNVQQAIKQIDGLNSQYLPILVLDYPDTIWVYRTTPITDFPLSDSTSGFDMGNYFLDPYSFSVLTCASASCPVYSQTTFSFSSSSTNTTTGANPGTIPPNSQGSTILLIVSFIVVIALITLGTAFSKLRKPKVPPI
jgi:ABC-type transport system substrate-binding protein